MNLANIHRREKEIVNERNQALDDISTLHNSLPPMLLRHLREQTYKFYEPELKKLEIQFEAIQEYIKVERVVSA